MYEVLIRTQAIFWIFTVLIKEGYASSGLSIYRIKAVFI